MSAWYRRSSICRRLVISVRRRAGAHGASIPASTCGSPANSDWTMRLKSGLYHSKVASARSAQRRPRGAGACGGLRHVLSLRFILLEGHLDRVACPSVRANAASGSDEHGDMPVQRNGRRWGGGVPGTPSSAPRCADLAAHSKCADTPSGPLRVFRFTHSSSLFLRIRRALCVPGTHYCWAHDIRCRAA